MRSRLLPSLFLPLAALAGTARGAEPGSAKVVELPPLIVTEEANPLPWRYAEAPGLEVLSLCSDATTREFMDQFHRVRQLLELVVPPGLQVGLSAPVVHILGNTDMQYLLKQDVQREMFHGAEPAGDSDSAGPPVGRGILPDSRPRITVLPNLRLQDDDAYAIFALLDDPPRAGRQLSLTADYVDFLLQRRAPPLPAWFILGTMRLYPGLSFGPREVELAPMAWTSAAAAKAVRKDPAAALLPMAELLVAPRLPANPPEATRAYRAAWAAQSALLVRWAIDDKNGAREAFFKFVDRASRTAMTEELFRESFGMGYAEMRERLGHYLAEAMDKTIRLRPASPAPGSLGIKLRPAAPAEIARLKGDWERMEVGFVKGTYPALSGKYLEQARRTFRHAYNVGERDPRLLAAMGLCECDAGDDAAAQPFLAAAVPAGIDRPRPAYELARILYAQARAAPAGRDRKLSGAQTAAVLGPLVAARRLSPPLADAAELFSDLWFHTELTPLPADFGELDRATRLFPNSLGLVYRTALLNAQAGRWPDARRLVAHGLATAPSPEVRARFAQLDGLLPPAAP